MAIYHLHVGIVSRKTGRSSVGAAAYRAGEKLHNERDGITHDYTNRSSVSAAAYRAGERLTNEQGETHDFTNKRGVVYSEIMLPENAPRCFFNREILWNAVEKAEKQWNAQTARDIDVALPIELDRQEQIELIREYIQDNFVKYGMIADFSIHDKGDGNPHAHIMLTTRHVSEKGFGGKNRDWNKPQYLKQWRENWAGICNEKFQQKGLDERIDHRTLKAQGIDREPTIHIGVTAKAMERKGIDSDRMREYNEITARNEAKNPENIAKYMHELKEGYFILDKETSTLNQEIIEAKREINSLEFKVEKITERAENINAMRKRLDELQAQRQKMGFFEDKKSIDKQIRQIEYSHEQAEAFFKRTYDISPENAAGEAKRLEDRARSLGHLKEKLQDKLTPYVEEKDVFMLEYQKQKLLAEINPNGQKIQDELTRLTNENRPQSVQDRLIQSQSERALDTATEQNFQNILIGISTNAIRSVNDNQTQQPEETKSLYNEYEAQFRDIINENRDLFYRIAESEAAEYEQEMMTQSYERER